MQMGHVHKCRSCKHDRLVKDEADLAEGSIAVFNNHDKVIEVNERHVGMDELNVCPEKLIAKAWSWYRERALLVQVLDLVRPNSGWERLDEVWQIIGCRRPRSKEAVHRID